MVCYIAVVTRGRCTIGTWNRTEGHSVKEGRLDQQHIYYILYRLLEVGNS